MGNQAGIIIRNVKNELFHSAKRLILNEVKGIECLQMPEGNLDPSVKNDPVYNFGQETELGGFFNKKSQIIY